MEVCGQHMLAKGRGELCGQWGLPAGKWLKSIFRESPRLHKGPACEVLVPFERLICFWNPVGADGHCPSCPLGLEVRVETLITSFQEQETET